MDFQRPDTRLLSLAKEEQDIYLRKYLELTRKSRSRWEPLVDDLRRIPAADDSKKEALADFFRSEDGQGYNAFERRQAYDALLGPHRNRENRG